MPHPLETAYLAALKDILEHGNDRETRNGMTRSKFAIQIRGSIADNFPALTTKKLAWKAVVSELLWFIGMHGKERANDHDLRALIGKDTTIWTANAESDYWKPHAQLDGDLGRIYGIQWRNWRAPDGHTIDQLAEVIERVKKDPYDRRLIVSAWNPGELGDMALPPCHILFQLYVENGALSLHMVQRSCDMFLGVPFNIASYSLLLAMLAHATGLRPGEFVHTMNDAHIYHDHFDAVREQLSKEPFAAPKLWLNPERTTIDEFTVDDIRLEEYHSHERIMAAMAV